MLPFVSVALAVQEKMEMYDKESLGIVMRFAKVYRPEKMGRIVEVAKTFPWWQKNPKAAFMKAVGMVNREEKNGQ